MAEPSQITLWVLTAEETQALFEGGHGKAPDLVYAGGVPDTPDPGLTNFDKSSCTLILLEIGFSRDLKCDKKLTKTLVRLTTAFSTFRPRVDQASANKGTPQPITDSNAKSYDYRLFRSLLDALTDLA